MSTPLHVLIIDDSKQDSLLIERALHKDWPGLVVECIESKSELHNTLQRRSWDCVICDMVIPGFGASSALRIVRKVEPELPFIIVSGVVKIEDVISLLKNGAHDFVRKDDLRRLVPAIKRALEDATNRQRETRATKKLQESEEQYRTLIEQSPLSIQIHGPDGRLRHVNTAFKKLWGVDDHQLNMLMDDYNILEDAEFRQSGLMEQVKAVFEGGYSILPHIEYDFSKILSSFDSATPAAKKYWIGCRGYPVKSAEGSVLSAIFIMEDLTAEHDARQALLIQEQEQRDILDNMLDGVVTIDETGTIVNSNKAAEKLFGYQQDELLGKSVGVLMVERGTGEHDAYMRHYTVTGEAKIIGIGREVEGLHKDKHTFPMRLSVAELPLDASGKRRFVGTCHDLSEAKQLEEQVRRSQKMDALGKLTGGVAHDFNNMLSVVNGYADLLQVELADKPKLAEFAHEISHAGARGAKLTKKLLSFARAEDPEAAVVNISELLLQQQDVLRTVLTPRVDLLVDVSDEIWPVWLDKGDLEDAILNMSINAMHAMEGHDADAKLTISTRNQSLDAIDAKELGLSAGDYVRLSLTDTGVGMSKSTIDKIFDPFFSTKGEKGTGLGLSQVFGFVKRTKGTIDVYSKPGKGSHFLIYFPRYLQGYVDEVVLTGEDDAKLMGNENILVVDDEAALCELTTQLLEQKGYQTFRAKNAKQALRILGQEHIDLMLTDIIMPGMDGYQLAVMVQKRYPDIKIQLVSGYSEAGNLDLIDESLGQNLLAKPFSSNVLFKSVRDLLDNRVAH